MNLSNLNVTLPSLYESRAAVHLVSGPGVGKSSVARQSKDKLAAMYGEEFGFVEVLTPTIDAPDVKGYLVPHKNPDGTATSYYTESFISKQVRDSGKDRGIILIDEFKQGEQLTQKALAPLILDRTIGDWTLPDGWWVIMASNRTKDRSGASRMMSHITNRVVTLNIDGDVDAWAEWAVDHGMHPMGMAFAKSRPGVVFADEVPADPDHPFCSPRSFTRAMDFLSQLAGKNADGSPNMDLPNDVVTNEIIQGFIGDGAAAELFSYLKVADIIPSLAEILKDPAKVALPPGDRLDAQYAVISLITHHADTSNVDKLWTVVERLAKELQASTAKTLISKSGGVLMNSQALGKWITQNKALVVSSFQGA